MDRSIQRLLDKEIQTTERVLNVFDRKRDNDPSLVHRLKKFSRNDVEDCISEYAGPLFSLYYMSYLLKNVGTRENVLFTRDVVQDRIGKKIESEFGYRDCEMVQFLLRQSVDRNDWRYLSLELLIGRMLHSRDDVYQKVRDEVELRVVGKMVLRNFSITRDELADIIKSEAQKFLENLDFNKNLKHIDRALEESWCWRDILERIGHLVENYKKITAMMSDVDFNLSIQRVSSYYNNPLAMEKTLFNGLSEHFDNTWVDRKKDLAENTSLEYSIKIPDQPRMRALLYEIDRMRREALTRINGSEEMDFFRGIDKSISEIIDQHIRATRNAFTKEESSLSVLKKGGGISGDREFRVVNERDFIEAKRTFEKNLRSLNDYRNRSVEFIKWLSSIRRVHGDAIVDLYKNRVLRNRNHVAFLRSMADCCSDTTVFDLPSAYKILTISMRRLNNVLKIIEHSLSLEKRYFPHMNRSFLTVIKNEKMQFLEELNVVKSEILSAYRHSASRHKKTLMSDREVENNLKEKVARYEIETLMKFLSDEIALYNSFKYAEEAFAFYVLKSEKLRDDAHSAVHSDELENVIQLKSILAVMEGFDDKRIKSEYITKRYLKKRILTGLSKLHTLLNFYYRKGVISRIGSELEELKEMGSSLGKRTEVSILSWVMNETNFVEIDRKVVDDLIRIRNRRVWSLEVNDSDHSGKNNLENYIEEIGITISIPDGWEKMEVENSEKTWGVIRRYRSLDKSADIYIARLPEKSRNLKEMSEIWLERMESRLIKMRWGKNEGFEYFWTLSRDSKKRIMEAYAIVNDKCAFVISGITTREKYRFFKSKMEFVFKSIKIRKEANSLAGGYY